MAKKKSEWQIDGFIKDLDETIKQTQAGTIDLERAKVVKKAATLIVQLIELQLKYNKSRKAGSAERIDFLECECDVSREQLESLKSMISLLRKAIKERKEGEP